MPAPILIKAPLDPEMTPAYAAGLLLSPPTVSVAAPSVTLPPLALPPVSEPIWVLEPVMSRVAPEAVPMTTAELLPKAPLTLATEATPAWRVPALTVVMPV